MGSLALIMELRKTLLILILVLNNGIVKGNIIEEMLIAVHQLQINMQVVMNKVENIETTLTVDLKSLQETSSKQDKILIESLENIGNTLKVDVNSLKENIKVLHEEVETNSNQDKIFKKSLENTLTIDVNSLKQNIKVLQEEVETNSHQDKILIESLASFKVEVRSFQKESLKNAEEIRLSLEQSLKQNKNSSEEIDRIKQNGKDCIESCLKPSDGYLEKIESLNEEVKSVQKSLKERVISVQTENSENAEKIYQKIESNLKEISKQNLELLLSDENSGIQKLYSDYEFSYYKVPVSEGTKLVEGTVPISCERVGLKAVCTGPAGCQYNSASCVITPLSSKCSDPMRPLAEILCGVNSVGKCSKFDGVYNYMYNWGKEFGYVDGSANYGKPYTSGE